jgi:hypothetical protein
MRKIDIVIGALIFGWIAGAAARSAGPTASDADNVSVPGIAALSSARTAAPSYGAPFGPEPLLLAEESSESGSPGPVDKMKEAGHEVKEGAVELGHKVKEGAVELGHEVKEKTVEAGRAVKRGAKRVGQGVKQTAQKVGQDAKTAAQEGGQAVKRAAVRVKEGAKDAAGEAADATKNAARKAKEAVTGMGSASDSSSIGGEHTK